MTEQEKEICLRIKLLRKELGMTQTEFGEKIEAAQGYLTNIETGKRPATEKILKIILLQSWNGKTVNEAWLRAGEGEMFNQMDAFDVAYNHFGYLMENATKQKKAVLSALIEMMYYFPDDKWDYVFEQFDKCLDEAHNQKEGKD